MRVNKISINKIRNCKISDHRSQVATCQRQPASGNLLPVILLLATLLFSLACVMGGSAGTAIPVGRPASFEVQTATPTRSPQLSTPELEPAELAQVLPLNSAPTDTPNPDAPPTLPPPPDTPVPTQEITPT